MIDWVGVAIAGWSLVAMIVFILMAARHDYLRNQQTENPKAGNGIKLPSGVVKIYNCVAYNNTDNDK